MNHGYIFWVKLGLAIILAIVGYCIIGRIMRRFLQTIERKVPYRLVGIIRYFCIYGFYFLLIIIVLQTAGVNLSALLAAAGIAGIAIGFAAQTSLSNIISGILLLVEQSFKIGDLIYFENLEGHVESVGLLSMTLRTPDNRLIRIPNERLMRDIVINLTTHGQRMLSFIVTVDDGKKDIETVRTMLETIVNNLSYRLPDKPTTIVFFGSSFQPTTMASTMVQTIRFKVQFWVNVSDILAARSAFTHACLKAAQEQNPPLLLTLEAE